jgi:hypothetical protein
MLVSESGECEHFYPCDACCKAARCGQVHAGNGPDGEREQELWGEEGAPASLDELGILVSRATHAMLAMAWQVYAGRSDAAATYSPGQAWEWKWDCGDGLYLEQAQGQGQAQGGGGHTTPFLCPLVPARAISV